MNSMQEKIDNIDVNVAVATHNLSNNTHDDIRELINALQEQVDNIEIGGGGEGTGSGDISSHNTSSTAHNDIRLLITELTNRLNALADSDDDTLDQMKEVVDYIKANRELIESVTTTKVNVSDIIDNLTTNVGDRPLSAAQGVALKGLVDTMQTELDSKAGEKHTHEIADVNGLQTALNGKTQRVELSGSIQQTAYRRSVIALCETNAAISASSSFSNGTISIRRSNGLNACNSTIDLFIGDEYYSDYGISACISETSFDGAIHVKPCTFSYNGVIYGGIEIFVQYANSEIVAFDGCTNFKIFGLDYYDIENSVVLNEEVYNSLNYDNVTYSNNLYHNLKKVYTEGEMEIGGTNLLTGTKDFTGNWAYVGNEPILDDDSFKYFRLIDSFSNFVRQNITLEPNNYTLSFYAKSDNDVAICIKDDLTNVEFGYVTVNDSNWKKYSIIIPSTLTVTDIMFLTRQSDTPIYIKKIKLERGNVATDYSPAPEDKADKVHTHDIYASKSIYGDNSISIDRYPDSTVGYGSIAIGARYTIGGGPYTNIITGPIASGRYSYAHGGYSINAGTYFAVTASGDCSHAEGIGTDASGNHSHAEGQLTTASGNGSHAEGHMTTASGSGSHAEGNYTVASGTYSHAEGHHTTALYYQHALGHYNNTSTATAYNETGTTTGSAFVIGNGTSSSLSNAFRVTGTGTIYATNATISTGADYAEYFEWSDSNPNNEDRVGYFVTLDENDPKKIRIANEGDYILGIVSGMPSVIGNGDECWKQRYILDEFGRYIEEEFEYEEEIHKGEDEEGNPIIETVTKTGTKYKENPDYDASKEYIQRKERAEWDAVGMLGVLSVYDDGTCKVNQYCKCSDNGIATATTERGYETYRVINRVSDNIIEVIFK